MAERKEAKRGQMLSATAAQREAGHMRKAIADRNKRIRDAVKEATAKRKAEERARRVQEAAEARQREEEERERLRAAQTTRESLPRQASADARGRSRESPPGTGERVYGGARLTEEEGDRVEVGADDENQQRDTVAEIADLARQGVRPVPRRIPAPTAAFEMLFNNMTFPGADAEPGVILAAIINNQHSIAQQNALLLKAVQNKNEVRNFD